MARRKIDEMPFYTEEGLKGYEAIWSHIKNADNGIFTVTDILLQTNVRKQDVQDYTKRLLRAGYVVSIGKKGDAVVYQLIKTPCDAPRLNRKGETVIQGSGRDQMWRTIKMLGRFNKHDLAVHASIDGQEVKVSTAEDYIKFLHKAGYIRCVKPAKPKIAAEYVFLPSKNTGPKAPMIQRIKAVYDPNLKKVVWNSKEGVR